MRTELKIKVCLWIMIVGLILSGLTAFPLRWESQVLASLFGVDSAANPEMLSGMRWWLVTVRNGLQETYTKYPFIAYGTDWLAFAHLILAILFIGPLRDPVKNLWVIEFGLIACVLVIPMAVICGQIRGIPFYWRLIDCSFGVLGFMTLWLARTWTIEAKSNGQREAL